MFYLDPKDMPLNSGDVVLDNAWIDRKELRLKHFDVGLQIEALDTFIDTYVLRTKTILPMGGGTTFTASEAPEHE